MLQLLIKAGTEGKPTVFLFSDNQIKSESFMEDISMILNSGDVPNLYPADEKAEIIEKMQTVAKNEVNVMTSLDLLSVLSFLFLTTNMFCLHYLLHYSILPLIRHIASDMFS